MNRWKSIAGKALAMILSCTLVFGEGNMFAYAQSETVSMSENAADEAAEETLEETLSEEILAEESTEPTDVLSEENSEETIETGNLSEYETDPILLNESSATSGIEEILALSVDSVSASDNHEIVSENFAEESEIVMDSEVPVDYASEAGAVSEELWEKEEILASSAEESSNFNKQNYKNWAENINSYLVHLDDGRYMRVENLEGDILVEYYNSAFQLKSTKNITRQQSLFGGFYAGQDFYYVVYGKKNAEEKDTNIVMEVVKYDTSWKEIMSEKIKGCNTQTPFEAGSLRMTEQDGYLYIRTCHTMYKSSDGKNHQANWTIQIKESDMTVADSYYIVSNIEKGYVSHSFNQFILVDDNKNLVTLDHGDAYPRGIVIGRYGKKAGETSFNGSFENKTVFAFEGAVGNNYTGASVGGFEYSSDYYLIAGNTVERGDGWDQRSIRNVFVSSVNKSDLTEPKRFYLTEYAEDEKISTTTPQLVKISDSRFLLLWGLLEEGKSNGKISYVFLGADGKATGKIYTENGYLSDCKPIVVEDYIVWYATYKGNISYYLINSDGKFSASAKLGEEEASSDSSGEYFETSLVAATTASISKQYYTSRAIIPSNAAVNLVVGGKRLKQGTDYEITCTNNTEIGTATAVLTGIGQYQDSKTITFTIASRPLSKVKFGDTSEFSDYFVYDGEEKCPRLSLSVESNGEKIELKEGQDYFVKYYNNISAGTAKAVYTGVGSFNGTKTKTFKIRKLDITYCEDFTVNLAEEYEYIKGGLIKTLKEEVEVFYKGKQLKLNKDYKLTFKNYNPTKSVDGYALGTVIIKGKGSYSGEKTMTYRILCRDISNAGVKVADKIYSEKSGNYKITPTLKDTNGKSLVKKKDYSAIFEYYANGKLLEPTDIVLPGTEITVVVKAAENSMYTGFVSATYRVVEKSISKVKINCVNDIFYVTFDGVPLKEGVDYEIVSKDMIRYGSAYKVNIHGLGIYGYSKVKTVKRK